MGCERRLTLTGYRSYRVECEKGPAEGGIAMSSANVGLDQENFQLF